jgi:hypothetical protein
MNRRRGLASELKARYYGQRTDITIINTDHKVDLQARTGLREYGEFSGRDFGD